MKGNKNEDLNNSEDNNKQNENEKNDKVTEEKIINKDENEGGTLSCELIKDELASHDMIFKIIVIGDSFVGKSCITTRATKDIYENYYTTTVGFESKYKTSNMGYMWSRRISFINSKFLS